MEHYEVAIIGAGVMGSAAAYYLSKHYGKNVILVEQFDFLHRRGASHGDSRIIRKTYPQDHYTYLMIEAYKLWESLEDESQTKVLTRTGGIDIGPMDEENINRILNSAKKYDIPIQVLNPAEVKLKYPSVTVPSDCIGIYSSDAGIINATKAVAVFQSLAKANGCILRDNTVVSDVSQVTLQGELVTKIETAKGEIIICKKCIITTGPWSKKFLQNVNLDLPISAMQITVAYWIVDDPEIYSSSVFPVFLNYDRDSTYSIYGSPAHEFPNMIKCCAAGGPIVDPDNRDFLPGTEALEKVAVPFLRETFAGVSLVPAKTESCVYTWTPDGDFVIDSIPSHPGIFIGCAFHGHGFKLAPVVGKILAEFAISGQHLYPQIKKYFSVDRFRAKVKI